MMYRIIRTEPYEGRGGRMYGGYTWSIVPAETKLDGLSIGVMLGDTSASSGMTLEDAINQVVAAVSNVFWDSRKDVPAVFFGDKEYTPRQILEEDALNNALGIS